MADPPLPPAQLGPRLAEVYAVLGPLYRRVSRIVEDATPVEGVPIRVRAVLERLQVAGAETVPAIARTLALSRQFVQRSVNDAADRGWVETRSNPAHRRSSLIGLTAAGARAMELVQAREHARMGEVGGALTGAEIDVCLHVLRHMHAAVADVEV